MACASSSASRPPATAAVVDIGDSAADAAAEEAGDVAGTGEEDFEVGMRQNQMAFLLDEECPWPSVLQTVAQKLSDFLLACQGTNNTSTQCRPRARNVLAPDRRRTSSAPLQKTSGADLSIASAPASRPGPRSTALHKCRQVFHQRRGAAGSARTRANDPQGGPRARAHRHRNHGPPPTRPRPSSAATATSPARRPPSTWTRFSKTASRRTSGLC